MKNVLLILVLSAATLTGCDIFGTEPDPNKPFQCGGDICIGRTWDGKLEKCEALEPCKNRVAKDRTKCKEVDHYGAG